MSDRVFALIVLCLSAFYVFSATQIPTSFLSDPVGPKTFPIIVGSVAALAAIVVFLFPDDDPSWPGPRRLGVIGLAVLILIAYAATVNPVGFLIPTAIASAAISFLIQPRAVQAAITGVAVSGVLFVIFRFALGLSLRPFPREWMG